MIVQGKVGETSPFWLPERMRPTLFVGPGGSGHRIGVRVKALAEAAWGPETVKELVRFLVFDTAQESLSVPGRDGPVRLEPGSEFIDIGQTPVPNIQRNLEHQSAIKERLGAVMASLPPAVLRNGAKQLRPLGLLAFLWRYPEVETRLHDAIWDLANRQRGDSQLGINVFIANSLPGGTGSSVFLDIAHLIRDLFDELGTLADFCYITGVGVLPRAFHGVSGPNLVPNTVASLQELNHCMMRGDFSVRYPNNRIVATRQPPFNIYYLVDGVDERGRTWHGLDDVCQLAAEAIFLQMGSQVGQKQENDFDNLDNVLVQQTEEGVGTFCGSFGLASVTFSGPRVARSCAARQAIRVIRESILAEPAPSPDGADDPVAQFVTAAGLVPERLADLLARDDQGAPLAVELPMPAWADRQTVQTMAPDLVRYVRDYERARLGTDFKQWLAENETRLAAGASAALDRTVHLLARQEGLPSAARFLNGLIDTLTRVAGSLINRQQDRERKLEDLSRQLGQLENAFLEAAEGSFLGRARRVTRTRQAYLSAAEQLFVQRWQVQLASSLVSVFNRVVQNARAALAGCREAAHQLEAACRLLEQETRTESDAEWAAGGNLSSRNPAVRCGSGVSDFNLEDPALIEVLYQEHAPSVSHVLASLFSQDRSPLDFRAAGPQALADDLVAECLRGFQVVAELSVEDAIRLRPGSESPDRLLHWLMEQATPSWNLDRTRLPEGGSSLQRVQVLGVPDQSQSIFSHHAKMLASTGDRSRLVAFVAHVGAPHTRHSGLARLPGGLRTGREAGFPFTSYPSSRPTTNAPGRLLPWHPALASSPTREPTSTTCPLTRSSGLSNLPRD